MRRPRVLLLVGSIALSAIVGLAFAPASYDDGYITYRYADNFAHGRGFAFNPGETLLGTSAPGYAFLLGGLERLLDPLKIGVDELGAALFLAGFVFLPLLVARLIGQAGGQNPELVAGTFALLAIPSRWNAELMGCEQLPILVLVTAAFSLAFDRRGLSAGLCVGLAGALRTDAGLAVAAITLALWVDQRKIPWRFLMGASLPIVACWSWLLATFGSILPVTLAGKRSEMEFVQSSYNAMEFAWISRALTPPGVAAVLLLACVGLASARGVRGRVRLFSIAGASWILAHEIFYRAVGVPFAPWYHLAAFNSLLALAAVGAADLLVNNTAFPRPWKWALTRLGKAGLAALCVGAVLFATEQFVVNSWGTSPDARIGIYSDIAKYLRLHSAPGARVAAVEIGALAFFSNREVVDLAGLVNPLLREARREHRLSAALASDPPEFIVDTPAFHENFLSEPMKTGFLASKYRPSATFSRPEYPYAVRLLERADSKHD